MFPRSLVLGSVLLFVLLLPLCKASKEEEGPCKVDEDCLWINGSACIGGNCTCPEATQVLVNVSGQNSSYCLAGSNETGANCTFNQQCNYDEGRCTEEGKCSCSIKFTEKEGECIPIKKSALVPVAVGIVIGILVFGTLCLYLWLSRKKPVDNP